MSPIKLNIYLTVLGIGVLPAGSYPLQMTELRMVTEIAMQDYYT